MSENENSKRLYKRKGNPMSQHSSSHTGFLRTAFRHLLGEAVDAEELRKAKAHIAACPDCWETWMSMIGVATPATWTKFLEESTGPFPQGPTFAEEYRSAGAWEASEAGLWQRGRSYLARLTPEKALRQLVVFLNIDSWQPSLAAAHRGDEKASSDALSLQIDDLPDIHTSVSVTPAPDDRESAIITVEVSIESRFPDFSGVRVRLESDDAREEKVTGTSGVVRFQPVRRSNLPAMRLTILPPG